ncbi:zinc finger BED domain-containing protein RICESLEEPER 2-like [Bidens hawaiensis]|uniref:zinc finger BED domain-containing protein RICESLEEPER 2-like n=1 Tax=Bidens hawaiensis TaxID=980011 RepID=UPI00404A8A32
MANLLEVFKRKTIDISCSTYVVAHELYAEVMDIEDTLDDMFKKSNDHFEFMKMVSLMKHKFLMYFGDKDKKNMLFDFAVILDPRLKLDMIQYGCQKVVDLMEDLTEEKYKEMVANLVDEVKAEMQLLITEYGILYQIGASNPIRTENTLKEVRSSNCSWKAKFEKFCGGGNQSFGNKYLCVPVSTVASESAFSTGGRVVDPYRSSLSPNIVEALICTEDWIRKGRKEINEFEDLVKDEEFAKGNYSYFVNHVQLVFVSN